jgi:hypothetical protein
MSERLIQTIKDSHWRLSRAYSVINKDGNKVWFRQNKVQEKINQDVHKRKMILKARQFGVSTNGIIQMMDYALYKPNVTAVIMAHEQDSIKKLFRIAKRAYQYLDPEMKPALDRGGGSKYEMYFPEINSRVYCDLESRSDTIQYLHVSEAAFIKDPDKLKATLQAVPLDGRVVLESTPNGMGNYFYDLWNDSEQPYSKLFFPWFIFPEYKIKTDSLQYTSEESEFIEKTRKHYKIDVTRHQMAFRRFKQRELGKLFLQEYPEDDDSCFLSSGQAVMDLFVVKARLKGLAPPIEQDDYVKIFKRFDRSRTYVLGADCAEGVGGDFSVATLFDAKSREQVAILRGQLKPKAFAESIDDLCKRYRTAGRVPPLVAVERNNHGHAVLLELNEHIHYPNLYHREDDSQPGWVTDKVTRPIMIDTLIEGVDHSTILLNDSVTLSECLTLVNDNGKIQAATGKHDDCIVASAIALQMCIECSALEIYDNMKDKILV